MGCIVVIKVGCGGVPGEAYSGTLKLFWGISCGERDAVEVIYTPRNLVRTYAGRNLAMRGELDEAGKIEGHNVMEMRYALQ